MRSLLLVVLLLLPLATAESSDEIGATITLSPTSAPAIEAPEGLVRLKNETAGERYELNLTIPDEYATFEIRAIGFEIERARQIVPSLVMSSDEYPLFYEFPNDKIWEVDSPARVAFTNGTAQNVVLRLGVPGPANVTLVIERDVTPPAFDLGVVENVTHFSFYQETTTKELAVGDLQVRRLGATEWVQNPTPMLHFRQRFPVQGLQPETEYEARVVFTDWAGNEATTGSYRITTLAAPILPTPIVTPLSPAPNTTINSTFVTLRARVESPDSLLDPNMLSVFFDKRPITSGVRFEDGDVLYSPPEALAPGKHSVGIEVYNEAGGKGEAHWSFEVAGASSETPLSPLLAPLVLAAIALARRRS